MNWTTPRHPCRAARRIAPRAARLTRIVPLLVLLLAVVGSAPASASVTVGSGKLNTAGSLQLLCDSPPCVTIQDKIDGAFVATPTGVITSWSVRNAVGTIALRVLRLRGGLVAGELHATSISESADRTGSSADVVPQTFATRQPVKAGDYFGIVLQDSSRIGAYAGAGGDDDNFEVPSGDVDVDDTTADQYEQLLQVEVEPDADGDGYGDETQDACPTNRFTSGACPRPIIAPVPIVQPDPFASVRRVGPKMTLSRRSPRAGKTGAVSLIVKNGASVAVKGKVALSSKLARRKPVAIGSKRFSVPANGSATVKIKLSKKARRALRRKSRLAVTATTTAKAAQGKSSKRKTKLIVRRYKKGAKAPRVVKPKGRNGSYQGCFTDRSYGEDPDLPCGGGNYAVRFEVVNNVVQRFRVLSVHATCNRGPGTSGPFDPVATAPLNASGDFFSRSQRVGTTELEDFFEYAGKVSENGTAAGFHPAMVSAAWPRRPSSSHRGGSVTVGESSLKRSDGAPPAANGGWPHWRGPGGLLIADVVFGIACVLAVGVLVYLSRYSTFIGDEWTFIVHRRGWSLDALMYPHNEHWTFTLALVYKTLFATVGLRSYLPYLLVLWATHVAVCSAVYVLMRHHNGQVPALAGGVLMLFLGSGSDNLYWAFQIAFVGATAAGAWAIVLLLTRASRGAEATAAALLVVSVATSGVGLFFLAATAAMLAIVPHRRRRLWVVAPAIIAYVALVPHVRLRRHRGQPRTADDWRTSGSPGIRADGCLQCDRHGQRLG